MSHINCPVSRATSDKHRQPQLTAFSLAGGYVFLIHILIFIYNSL